MSKSKKDDWHGDDDSDLLLHNNINTNNNTGRVVSVIHASTPQDKADSILKHKKKFGDHGLASQGKGHGGKKTSIGPTAGRTFSQQNSFTHLTKAPIATQNNLTLAIVPGNAITNIRKSNDANSITSNNKRKAEEAEESNRQWLEKSAAPIPKRPTHRGGFLPLAMETKPSPKVNQQQLQQQQQQLVDELDEDNIPLRDIINAKRVNELATKSNSVVGLLNGDRINSQSKTSVKTVKSNTIPRNSAVKTANQLRQDLVQDLHMIDPKFNNSQQCFTSSVLNIYLGSERLTGEGTTWELKIFSGEAYITLNPKESALKLPRTIHNKTINPPCIGSTYLPFLREKIYFSQILDIYYGRCSMISYDICFLAINLKKTCTKLLATEIGPGRDLDPTSEQSFTDPKQYICITVAAKDLIPIFDYMEKEVQLQQKLLTVEHLSVSEQSRYYAAALFHDRQKGPNTLPKKRTQSKVLIKEHVGVIDLCDDEDGDIIATGGDAYNPELFSSTRSTRRSSRLSHNTLSNTTVVDPDDAKTIFEYPPEEEAKDVITMNRGDLKRLEDYEYLNDSIIDFRLKYFLAEMDPLQRDKIHKFSCQFFTPLLKEKDHREGYKKVQNWSKNIDLLSKWFIFIPVNLSAHWSLLIVVRPDVLIEDLKAGRFPGSGEIKSCIIFMDSLNLHNGHKFYKKLINYLNNEWRAKFKLIGEECNDLFHSENMPYVNCRNNIPKQTNSYDCGAYVIKYFHHMAHHLGNPTCEDISNCFSAYINVKSFTDEDISLERANLKILFAELSEKFNVLKAARLEAAALDALNYTQVSEESIIEMVTTKSLTDNVPAEVTEVTGANTVVSSSTTIHDEDSQKIVEAMDCTQDSFAVGAGSPMCS